MDACTPNFLVQEQVTTGAGYLKRPFEFPAESTLGALVSRDEEWDPVLVPIIRALVVGGAGSRHLRGWKQHRTSTRQILKAAPGAHVHCFDPSDRFRSFLERNLFLAGQSAEVLPYIVGKEAGVAVIHSDETSGMCSRPRTSPQRRSRGWCGWTTFWWAGPRSTS